MHRHPYFKLWLHDDEELGAYLGEPVAERVVIHEWPLSCVQRIRLESGDTRIYKVQAPPTIEPEFYGSAQSEILVSAQILLAAGDPAALLFDDLANSEPLHIDPLNETSATVVEEILSQIAQITGELPAVADIRTEDRWLAFIHGMVSDLSLLVESGSFRAVDETAARTILALAESQPVLEVIRSKSGYVHGDLKKEKIFSLHSGYRVIDWQRPFWGPVAIDAVDLMSSLGMDPTRHFPKAVIQLRRLLSIHWYIQCARSWFPPSAPDYDVAVAGYIEELKSS